MLSDRLSPFPESCRAQTTPIANKEPSVRGLEAQPLAPLSGCGRGGSGQPGRFRGTERGAAGRWPTGSRNVRLGAQAAVRDGWRGKTARTAPRLPRHSTSWH